jgi:hypothetical protein
MLDKALSGRCIHAELHLIFKPTNFTAGKRCHVTFFSTFSCCCHNKTEFVSKIGILFPIFRHFKKHV